MGGRGTIWGAVLGTLVISYGYDLMTSVWPDGWMFLLGAVFIVVPIWLPGGLISLPGIIRAALGKLGLQWDSEIAGGAGRVNPNGECTVSRYL